MSSSCRDYDSPWPWIVTSNILLRFLCNFIAFSFRVMLQIRVRVIIGVMIFFGYFMLYWVRYNLGVHIVDMAQIAKRDYNKYFSTSRISGTIDLISWDDTKMGKLFSAYHIGYCVCFPIFHSMGDRIGPTWVVGISSLISGILCCLTPASAISDFWALFFVRIITGFCAGAMQPSMVQVLRHWVPPIERNHFMWAYCGITVGTCSTFLICAAVHYYSRWPTGFYLSGGCQILWSIIWVTYVTDYPRLHSYISKEELDYLNNTIGTIFTIRLMNDETPWMLIVKSVPFWALCILNFGYAWMIIALCIHGPLYYSRIVGYDIYNAAALTALPFFLRLVLGTIVIQAFHRYRHSNTTYKKMKHIRKYLIVVSHVIPGILVFFTWMFPILVPGPILLTLAVGLTAAGMDLTFDFCYELTPNYVNSVHTVIKIIGNTSGIIVSLCVGQVTYKYKNSPVVWKHIWCFHATVLFISGVIFLIWGETVIQPWNYRKIRPPRQKSNIFSKASIMSEILEADEESGTIRMSQAA